MCCAIHLAYGRAWPPRAWRRGCARCACPRCPRGARRPGPACRSPRRRVDRSRRCPPRSRPPPCRRRGSCSGRGAGRCGRARRPPARRRCTPAPPAHPTARSRTGDTRRTPSPPAPRRDTSPTPAAPASWWRAPASVRPARAVRGRCRGSPNRCRADGWARARARPRAESRRVEQGAAHRHRVAVAPERVDLAVVREHAERLRQLPPRRRVGGVALVEHGDRRLERGSRRSGKKSPAVRHSAAPCTPRAAGQRADVERLEPRASARCSISRRARYNCRSQVSSSRRRAAPPAPDEWRAWRARRGAEHVGFTGTSRQPSTGSPSPSSTSSTSDSASSRACASVGRKHMPTATVASAGR
jgi:serine/arginine repetitive matrix protein 1